MFALISSRSGSQSAMMLMWVLQGHHGPFVFPIYLNWKFKTLLIRNHWTDFKITWQGLFLWWLSTKFVQAVMIHQKTWPLGERGIFSLYIYIKYFKNPFVRNHWTHFNIMAKMFPWWPSIKISSMPSWCIKKNKQKNIATRGQGYKIYTKILEWWTWLKHANLFARVSDIGPSWSSCLSLVRYFT